MKFVPNCPKKVRSSIKSESDHSAQLGVARIRMDTALPGGLPQIVSFVPLEKLLVRTSSAPQFVVPKFVEY